ncbi:hypothetical protein FHS31_002297 [Sphingomonas vulcanisoli]|uniref:Uncharacterized protein n=1 Tax=Sphingomonas vulcanisoli TaxID=1658060 RepID=A0ABX0TT97_9SPHN|nr:hypothetical protein [Sphingomonas vulcanisoli]
MTCAGVSLPPLRQAGACHLALAGEDYRRQPFTKRRSTTRHKSAIAIAAGLFGA